MIVYLAGPISGKSYEEAVENFEPKISVLKGMGYEVYYPFLEREYLRNERTLRAEGYENPVSTNRAIFSRDRWMLARADIILADLLSATEVSIGTMFELAWAKELGLHTIVLVPEGKHVHNHAFVREATDVCFHSVSEALDYLSHLAGDMLQTQLTYAGENATYTDANALTYANLRSYFERGHWVK